MIVEALKENGGFNDTKKTDIKVDIGRFDKIDYVAVNGIYTTDYDLDGHLLTVHCSTKLANNLTVSAKVNGKIAVATYQVVYNDGYNAYRVYTTNNILKVSTNIVSAIKSKLNIS